MKKTIVITGGTKGIGRAIAEKFASQGYNVAVCARSKSDLTSMLKYWHKHFKDSALYTFRADLSRKVQLKAFADHLLARYERIDILVNNAGTFVPGGILDANEGDLESMIETNLYSAYNMTRQLLPRFQEQNVGQIYNMCSVASIMAYPNGGAYSISKFALLGFTKCLREELKHFNIKVTAVIPGVIWTDLWAGAGFEQTRLMAAQDIADTIYSTSQLSSSSVVEEIIIRPQLGDL